MTWSSNQESKGITIDENGIVKVDYKETTATYPTFTATSKENESVQAKYSLYILPDMSLSTSDSIEFTLPEDGTLLKENDKYFKVKPDQYETYGVANILLRQVFEYLVIGKYFYKQQNEIWAEKWLEDRKYEVYDKILRLLKIPDKKHLCDFWKVLCSLAHATPSSQQISLDGQFNEIDIELSYNVVLILLCCKHVLVNYFYSNRKLMRLIKLSPEVAKEMVDLRQKSAAWIKETTSLFSEDGIKVLKDYKRYWVFKK